MNPTFLSLLLLFGIPAAVGMALVLRHGAKRKIAAELKARIRERLAGVEWLDEASFRRNGKVFRIAVGLNPLFERRCSMRVSVFCPTLLDAELRAARNIPARKTPQKLASDPFYGSFVLDSPCPDEAAAFFLSAKPLLSPVFPSRWGAVSRLPGEIVLSENRESIDDPGPDLDLLAGLAAIPAEPRWQGGIWTIRQGFEKHPPAWHWKPDQRAALPEGARRWCVSAWYGNAHFDLPMAGLLWTLAGAAPKRIVTGIDDLKILEHAFGRPAPVSRHVAALDLPEMAVAADAWFDGDCFDGFVAGDPGSAFEGAIRLKFLDLAVSRLNDWRFYARRLFDDEFSWFSGEYEILSTQLADEEVRRVFDAAAKEHGAEVLEIDMPFSFKMLREDRLEITRERFAAQKSAYKD